MISLQFKDQVSYHSNRDKCAYTELNQHSENLQHKNEVLLTSVRPGR